jgi:hypothetical protein
MNLLASNRTFGNFASWPIATFGFAARMLRPSASATLKMLLVALRCAPPGICRLMTVGFPGICFPQCRPTSCAATARLPVFAPITIETVLPL